MFATLPSCLWAQDTTQLLQNVVVTGQFAPTHIRNSLYNIKIINSTAIAQRGAVNLEQLLTQEGNMRIENDPVLGSSVRMNGLSGRYVKILLDGVPVVGRLNGNLDVSQFNLQDIERIEVVQGAMAAMYGSDAIGGVINLISKKSLRKKGELGLTVRYETRAPKTVNLTMGLNVAKRHSLRLSVSGNKFEGWAVDTTRDMFWNPKTQLQTTGTWQYDDEKGFVAQLRGGIMQEEVLNKGIIRRPKFRPYAFDDIYKTRRQNSSLQLSKSIQNTHFWTMTLGTDAFYRTKNTYRTDIAQDTSSLVLNEQDTTVLESYVARSQYGYQSKNGKWQGQLGVDYRYDQTKANRIVDTVAAARGTSSMQDVAVFSSIRYAISPQFSVEGSGRWAYNTRYNAPIVPAFHLKYSFKNDWQLRGSYSQGFRTPDFKELFFSFIDINHYILGNQKLKAEASETVQLSLEKRWQEPQYDIQTSVNLFYNQLRNQITLFEYKMASDGAIVPVGAGESTLKYTYFNLESLRTVGGNYQIRYKCNGFSVGAQYVLTGYENQNAAQLDVPLFSYTNDVQFDMTATVKKTNTQVSLLGKWNDVQQTFYPSVSNGVTTVEVQRTEGFALLDATLRQPLWKDRVTLAAGVRNILDRQQVTRTNTQTNSGVHSDGSSSLLRLNPGRSFWLQVQFSF